MFGISWNEYILIAIVALIVIGPKELPGVLRAIGQWTAKIRRMAAEFQGQFHEAMREAEMSDLKKEVDDLSAQARGLTSQFSDPMNFQDTTKWEYKPDATPLASPDKPDAAPPADAPAPAAPGLTAAESAASEHVAGEHGAGQGAAAGPAEDAAVPVSAAGTAPEPAAPETAGAKG
jgi:sec-independent protein translocase protein TatB